jgi:pimeloyl-ACP methyl ester carboxylesterase
MPVVSGGGVSLRYDRAGSGPLVLLLHAWVTDRTVWARQVQALRDRATLVAVDLRGHGESSKPRTGYTLRAMADDLERLIAVLGARRLAVVGWSMGGVLAVELARRLGDRLAALGLVSTTAGIPLGDPAQGDRAAAVRSAMSADFRGFVRSFTASFFATGKASPLHPWLAGLAEKTPPHAAAACFETFLAADLADAVSAVRVPTAVLHGRHDALLPLAHAEAVAGRIPGARLAVFEQSGHAPLLEEPDAVSAALGELLARSS